MNKAQLVEKLANHAHVSKADAERVLNAFVETTVSTVRNGNKISVSGLGTFEKVERAARMGINPATGAKLEIKAKNAPKFKAAKSFKDRVAN